MADIASWIATIATIAAACLTASNLGARLTGIGFVIFTVASLAWLATGYATGQPALVWTNVVMTGLNLFGVWRWLGRQARLDEGAEQAARTSKARAGETLFPASLLTRATVIGCDHAELGHAVEAMAGCEEGAIRYLVVATGGVGGVGETLRRLPWSEARVDGETIGVDFDTAGFAALEEVEKDDWR